MGGTSNTGSPERRGSGLPCPSNALPDQKICATPPPDPHRPLPARRLPPSARFSECRGPQAGIDREGREAWHSRGRPLCAGGSVSSDRPLGGGEDLGARGEGASRPRRCPQRPPPSGIVPATSIPECESGLHREMPTRTRGCDGEVCTGASRGDRKKPRAGADWFNKANIFYCPRPVRPRPFSLKRSPDRRGLPKDRPVTPLPLVLFSPGGLEFGLRERHIQAVHVAAPHGPGQAVGKGRK